MWPVNASRVSEDVARIQEALGTKRHVLVTCQPGSAYEAVFRALSARPEFVAVEAPPLSDADAQLHWLLAAADQLGAPALQAVAHSTHAQRADELLKHLGDDRVLMVRLPRWRVWGDTDTPDQRAVAERARAALETLGASGSRVLLLADLGTRLSDSWSSLPLDAVGSGAEALDPERWGPYATILDEVATVTRETRVTDLQVRLAVALVALGRRTTRVVAALRGPQATTSLSNALLDELARKPGLARGLAKVALARFHLSMEDAISLAALPPDHLPLLTHCLSDRDDVLRMSEVVRSSIADLATEPELTHYELARRHAALDGTASVLESPSPVDWLERTHHLGRSGARGADEWAELDKLAPELFWERGRALSLAGRLEEAAAVYDECRRRFEGDDYAHHYFAFNRDRAGFDDDATETAYRKAIELQPSNAWWNSRLVTYLVATHRYIAARQAWAEACERVDRDGVGGDWIARHFHRWVVDAWLDRGEVELAREAFEAIPSELHRHPALVELVQRFRDLEEAARLGESVYPASVAMDDRWCRPLLVSNRGPRGEALIQWYPARVVEAGDEQVLLTLGVAGEEGPSTMLKELTRGAWNEAAQSQETPSGYWEIGSYEHGVVRARPHPHSTREPSENDDPMRFVRRRLGM